AALGRWRRHQHIVNPEVAVGRQRDTRNVGTELGEGRRGFTNQRREDAGVAVRANGIASAQQQASAVDLDTPVDLHVRFEIGDHPDLAGRVDAADSVPNHVREAAVSVGGTRHVRYRKITDSSPEAHQLIISYYRRSKGSSYEDHNNKCKQTLFHNCTSIFIFFHGDTSDAGCVCRNSALVRFVGATYELTLAPSFGIGDYATFSAAFLDISLSAAGAGMR